MKSLYCSGYESINARVYVCNNLCTVLGKNAPNGYTEIHQSILNSYSIMIRVLYIGYVFSDPEPVLIR